VFKRKKHEKEYTEITTNLQNISGDLVRLSHAIRNIDQMLYDESKKERIKLLENIDKILKIIAIYLAVWGALHIFLWASYISSWNLADTAFIIQHEGIGGGVSRMFALIVAHVIMLLGVSIFFALLISLIGFPVIFGKWIFVKFNNRLDKTNSLIICIFSGFVLFCILAVVYIWMIAFIFTNIFYMENFSMDGYFDYWSKGKNIFMPLFVVSAMVLIGAFIKFLFVDKSALISEKDILSYIKKTLFICLIIVLMIFPFFVFTDVYSKGYGTECIYLKVEEGSYETQRKYIYDSISSGGDEVIDELSGKVNGKERIYSLSGYIYSEDKDNLNIMVFSLRQFFYSNDENEYRPGIDLLGYKRGVLMSINKKSIEDRHVSNPYCFNGKI
jgi:hypothetical protein